MINTSFANRDLVQRHPERTGKNYCEILEAEPGFHNPSCVNNLIDALGIEDVGSKSKVESIRKLEIPDSELAINLRQQQSRQHALQWFYSFLFCFINTP